MEQGVGFEAFSKEFSKSGRYFDVGIAEEYAVTFAAALAAGGALPVFAVYSTFLQRGLDQLLHDCAIEKRHIVLGVDRAGIVGDDGETHQGIFDVAMLSAVPGMTFFSPATIRSFARS
jgi:1-deoxy-D-xylulose-5-phosphate synthase